MSMDVVSTIDDAETIRQILGGQHDQFQELVSQYLPMVRGLCFSRVADAAVCDDLVQDAFADSYLRLRTLRNHDRFGPWLAGIARNKCKVYHRKKGREARAYERVAREATAVEPDAIEQLSRAELSQWVRGQLEGLPTKTRDAMALCYIEGLTQAEAARMLGVRENTVKQRLHYGRQRLGQAALGAMQIDEAERDSQSKRVFAAMPIVAWEPRESGLPEGTQLAESYVTRKFVISAGVAAAVLVIVIGIDSLFDFAIRKASTLPRYASLELSVSAVRYGPGNPEVGLPSFVTYRLAPQAFKRIAFHQFLEEYEVPRRYWGELEAQLLDLDAWRENLEVTPERERELQQLQSFVDVIAQAAIEEPAKIAIAYQRFLPDPSAEKWQMLTVENGGNVTVDRLSPGLYVLEEVGADLDLDNNPTPPWMNPVRKRFMLESGDGRMLTVTRSAASESGIPVDGMETRE